MADNVKVGGLGIRRRVRVSLVGFDGGPQLLGRRDRVMLGLHWNMSEGGIAANSNRTWTKSRGEWQEAWASEMLWCGGS